MTLLCSRTTQKWPSILVNFDELWVCTPRGQRLQNVGEGPQPSPVSMQGNTVEPTDCFTYLGIQIHSCGRSSIEIFRRIVIALNVMGLLTNVWRQSKLSLSKRCVSTTLSLIRFYCTALNTDKTEILWAETLGLPHANATTAYSWDTLVRFCDERWSSWLHTSRKSHHTNTESTVRCSETQLQRTPHFVCS